MTKPKLIELKTEQDTIALAEFIAPLLRPGDVVCLFGNLGSGKTFFSQALGKFLGVPDDLDSPSFVILKEYHTNQYPLYHLDLYRLKSAAELHDLGIFDILESGITLIEWPELAVQIIPPRMLNLDLRFTFDGRTRSVEIVAKDRFSAYFV